MFKDQGEMEQSDDKRVTIRRGVTSEPDEYVLQVVIHNITQDDGGQYSCKASNRLGEKTAPISVSIPHGIRKTLNVTECCRAQNVSADCIDICAFSVDFDDLLRKPQCFSEFSQIMFCASDGRDHRACCQDGGVPRQCLNWCRGKPSRDENLCAASHSGQILGCFHAGQDTLPSQPRNPRVHLTGNHSALVSWDPPAENPDKVELYRVYYRLKGTRDSRIYDTKDRSFMIDDLVAGHLYEVVLKAGNSKGTSHLTPPIEFLTSNQVLIERTAGSNVTAIIVFSIVFILATVIAVIVFIRRRNVCSSLKSKRSSMSVYFENPFLNLQNIQHVQTSSASS